MPWLMHATDGSPSQCPKAHVGSICPAVSLRTKSCSFESRLLGLSMSMLPGGFVWAMAAASLALSDIAGGCACRSDVRYDLNSGQVFIQAYVQPEMQGIINDIT